jgi:hypothetical protein
VEIIAKNTQDSFKVGWDDAHLYLQETDQKSGTTTTYALPLIAYENDSYVDTFSQHVDPTSHGDPVWVKTQVPIKQKINVMSFDLSFESTSTNSSYSRGFLSISIDGKPVGEAFEEQEGPGRHRKVFYFTPPPLGTSTLEIRLDPLNPRVKSSMTVENFSFGFATSTGR